MPTPRQLLAAPLLALPLLALVAWTQAPRSAHPDSVAVTLADLESSVSALGTLQPRHYVDVGAQASGQILKLHVEPGDSVRQGDLLVEIDPSTQQAKVDAGRYSIQTLEAQLAEQRAQHELANQQHARQRTLLAGGAGREEDLQVAQAQARATLRSDEAELGYTRIYAPLSGTVVALDARVGQTLNAQQQTPLILRIAQLSPMTLWAQVSEADIGRIQAGMPAWFSTLGGGGRRWDAKVRQILPLPPRPLEQLSQGGGSPTAGGGRVVLYTVLLDVDNPDGALMTDMTAQVQFVEGHARNALTIPLAALRDGDRVRVVNERGAVEERQLRIGLRDRMRVQVLTGLAEGERLLVGDEAHEG